ncbi:MAG: DNA replication/repair protein RecF [Anaerolineae bacterium]|nr:DNA replication/repair protein RecF [Anaerolineae bacterium]
MYIRSLSLRHFRTYTRLELDLPAAPILLIGANAQGKTSLLEAIAYLALGHSPLTPTDQHLLNWGAIEQGVPFAQVQAEVVKKRQTETLEIVLQRAQLNNGGTRLGKRIRVNNHPVRRADLAGHLNTVIFLPEDVGLLGGPPAGRRRRLDDLLSQLYPEYVTALTRYQSALTRRNVLLRHLRERGGDRAQLEPLEGILAQTGVLLADYRQRAIIALSLHADRFHQELTGGKAWLQLQYRAGFAAAQPQAVQYRLALAAEQVPQQQADLASLEILYRETLLKQRDKELSRGITLMGPHRDDICFLSEGVDLGDFGSRGQQRSAVLAWQLAELHWLQQLTGDTPVLLLDEVLAELDRARRGYLLDLLGRVEQTILATTDAELFPVSFRQNALTFVVNEGIVTQVQGV